MHMPNCYPELFDRGCRVGLAGPIPTLDELLAADAAAEISDENDDSG